MPGGVTLSLTMIVCPDLMLIKNGIFLSLTGLLAVGTRFSPPNARQSARLRDLSHVRGTSLLGTGQAQGHR